ncbi:C2H2-type domain-containing protein [Trichoderma simmonsii]|uniref:C2H2-type domain-containing protein n=1 Tax=Trichoderma simmonsii TaxID=1491479 RepID=A0A8G0LFD6_9HYPO|nr:C2H2-type domain-containing protein [Trichoderma simmonsii]
MAQPNDDTNTELWQSVENLDDDIMRFSQLDLACLGLATETDHETTGAQNLDLPGNHFLPFRLSSYEESIDESLSNRGLFDGYRSIFADSIESNVTPPTYMIDPSLNEPRWQAPSFSLQSTLTHNFASHTERGEREETPATRTHTYGPTEMPQYSPAAENQPRGLPRRRSRYFRSQKYQPTLPPPIDIASSTVVSDALDPMQRWRESPPETEPASLSAIADALKHAPLRTRSSSAGSFNSQQVGSRAASTISFGSGTSYSSASNASTSSATFQTSSNRSRSRVMKRTRASTTKMKDKDQDKRIFPCTFCCDSFKSKYDWARHEKSFHLNLERWRCAPFGGTVISPETGRAHCAYCSMLDPNAKHLDSHNHGACESQGQTPTFSRKDHLVQHLRLAHHVETLPIIDSWKDQGPPVSSRCGFCNIRMQTWQERVDHLTKHFRKGATMDNWKGEHCFESSVAVKVTHAMPPYLIGAESRALIPFSVTSHGTKDHLSQIQQATEQSLGIWDGGRTSSPISGPGPSPGLTTQPALLNSFSEETNSMTFPEVLALHLGRYAQEQMRLGIIPTDRMFQDEARRIMFNSVDPWDQTIADDDYWLSMFRDRHLNNAPVSKEGSA